MTPHLVGEVGHVQGPAGHPAVALEGRSKSEVARDYDVSRYWVQQLVKRYETEGAAAFEPHSRRPHRNPQAVSTAVEDKIVRLRKTLTKQGYDAGAATIAAHLTVRHIERGPDNHAVFGVLAYGDSVLRLAPRGFNVLPTQAPATTGAGPTSVLYAYCQDVDDMYARATLAGAKSDDAPSDMPWGDRICILADPDGYIWSFATKYVEE